jgi:hypothetical protein
MKLVSSFYRALAGAFNVEEMKGAQLAFSSSSENSVQVSPILKYVKTQETIFGHSLGLTSLVHAQ